MIECSHALQAVLLRSYIRELERGVPKHRALSIVAERVARMSGAVRNAGWQAYRCLQHAVRGDRKMPVLVGGAYAVTKGKERLAMRNPRRKRKAKRNPELQRVGFGVACGKPSVRGAWLLEVERYAGRYVGYATNRTSARTYGMVIAADGTELFPKDIGGRSALPDSVRKALAARLRACKRGRRNPRRPRSYRFYKPHAGRNPRKWAATIKSPYLFGSAKMREVQRRIEERRRSEEEDFPSQAHRWVLAGMSRERRRTANPRYGKRRKSRTSRRRVARN